MIYDRIVSDKADVDYNVSTLHQVEPEKVKAVVERLDNLTVIDNINEVEAIEELIYSAKPDIVILDYIQIVSSHKRFSDNRQRIDYISQKLKMAAKKTNCVVISLSQITRGGKDCPTMSDLKESGGLEQDSDYILLLYREYVNDKGNAGVEPEETIITLDKNKFGRTGEFDMKFIGNRQRFIEADAITRPVNTEDEDNDLPFDL
jgi:replicative DNA helicase